MCQRIGVMPKLTLSFSWYIFKTILCILVCEYSSLVHSAAYGLEDLLAATMSTYPEIVSQQQALEAAGTELTVARLQFLPSISLSTQRNQVRYNDNAISSSNLPASNASVTQPIFMGGKLIAGHSKATANVGVAEYTLLETQERIAKRLIASYADWRRSYEKILALEHNVATHKKLLDVIARRTENGVAAGVDRDLVIARLNEAEAELEAQRAAERDALVSLSELAGLQLARKDLTGYRAVPAKLPPSRQIIDSIVNASPTVKRLQFEAEAADAYADELRAQALPQVYLQAQRQVGNAYTPGWPAFNSIGVVVQYTPGAAFSSALSANAAYTRAKSSRTRVEAVKRELATEIGLEISAFEAAQIKREKLAHSVKYSINVSDSYDRQYFVGKKSWLDLMNAVREEVQNKVAMADADASLLGTGYKIKAMLEAAGYY